MHKLNQRLQRWQPFSVGMHQSFQSCDGLAGLGCARCTECGAHTLHTMDDFYWDDEQVTSTQ